MGLENLLVILIGICGLTAVEGALILGAVIRNGKKASKSSPAPVPVPTGRSESPAASSPAPARPAAAASKVSRREGFVLCRSCYGVMPEHSRICSACGTAADGRN